MQFTKVALGAALSILLASGSAVAAHADEAFDYTKRTFTMVAPFTPSAAVVNFKVLASNPRSITVSWNASAFAPAQTPVQQDGEVDTLTSFGYANGCTFNINAGNIVATQPNSAAEDFGYTRNVWPTIFGTQVTTLDVSPGMVGSVQLDCFTYYDYKSVADDGTTELRRGSYELPGTFESDSITVPEVAPLAPTLSDAGGDLSSEDGNLYFAAKANLEGDGTITQAQYVIYRNGTEFRNKVKAAVAANDEDWMYNENFPPNMLTGTYTGKVRYANSAGWGPWSATFTIAKIVTPNTASTTEDSAPDADDIAAAKKALAAKLIIKSAYLHGKTMAVKWSAPSTKWTKISYYKVGVKKALHTQKVSAKQRSTSWKSAKFSKVGSYYVKLSALNAAGKTLIATGLKIKAG